MVNIGSNIKNILGKEIIYNILDNKILSVQQFDNLDIIIIAISFLYFFLYSSQLFGVVRETIIFIKRNWYRYIIYKRFYQSLIKKERKKLFLKGAPLYIATLYNMFYCKYSLIPILKTT